MRINLYPLMSISLPLLFLFTFFYYPLLELLLDALKLPFEKWLDEMNSPLVRKFTLFTFQQAILTVIFSVIIGLPTGYLLARTSPTFPKFLRAFITVPFIFPSLAILIGFVIMYEENGLLSDLFNQFGISYQFNPFSFWGIILAHTMYNVPVIARISESSLSSEPGELHEIAETLGASKFTRFRMITLPHIRPSLEAAILLVFLYAFNSFAIVLILGQIKFQTIEVMIYQQIGGIRLNFERATILAFYQLAINLLVITLYSLRTSKRFNGEDLSSIEPSSSKTIPTFIIIGIGLILWLPILGLLVKTIQDWNNIPDSVRNNVLTGEYDQILGTSSLRVMGNTLLFGIVVAVFTLLMSLLFLLSFQYSKNQTRLGKVYVPLTLLPMATSAITLSFALLSTYGANQNFSQSIWIFIISAQILAAIPFATRMMLSSWSNFPTDLILLARTLGANTWTVLRKIIFPYLKPVIMVVFLFSFGISIGEFGATFFLARGEWITLSLAIDKLFGSRNSLLPNLYASILIIFALTLFWMIEKVGRLELRV